MGKLGTAVLGCTATPLPGSRFCAACRDYAAHRSSGPAEPGNQSVAHVDFGVAQYGEDKKWASLQQEISGRGLQMSALTGFSPGRSQRTDLEVSRKLGTSCNLLEKN